MKLLVLGAGGVGGYFGGLVAAAGGDVTFVARGAHGVAIRDRGLLLRTADRGDVHVRPAAVVLPGEPLPPADAIVLAVKHRDLVPALESIASAVASGTPVLTLLNGLGHEEDVARLVPGAHVLVGMAFVGAHVEAPGVIRHTSEGRIAFGEPAGPPGPLCEPLRAALAAGGFPVRVVADVRAAVWRKVLWNAAFNSANALVGGTCADLMAEPETVAHLRAVMEEVRAVARANGVELPDEWVEQSLGADVNRTPYRTSMALDLERGRPLEIEPILARPVRIAERHGVAVPRLGTLVALLRAAERARERGTPS